MIKKKRLSGALRVPSEERQIAVFIHFCSINIVSRSCPLRERRSVWAPDPRSLAFQLQASGSTGYHIKTRYSRDLAKLIFIAE